MRPDGFRRISIHTDMEFGRQIHGNGQVVGEGLQPLSNSRVTKTILEDEHVCEDEEEMWHGGLNESHSSSLLPKTRRVQKRIQIRESVL